MIFETRNTVVMIGEDDVNKKERAEKKAVAWLFQRIRQFNHHRGQITTEIAKLVLVKQQIGASKKSPQRLNGWGRNVGCKTVIRLGISSREPLIDPRQRSC